ncbi:unnamed protein product [Symbiodinium sp. CCMP2592]|nr:unnamed protein product [Symbiodinium sp. CCMP2592]
MADDAASSAESCELNAQVASEWVDVEMDVCENDSDMDANDSDVDAEEFQTAMKMLKITEHVARMQLSRPEMLRVTSAGHMLERCGQGLRRGPACNDLYFLSRPVNQIQQFCSHSWHGRVWEKVVLLLLVFNGLPALLMGTLVVVLTLALLEAYSICSGEAWYCNHAAISTSLGVLVTGLTFLFWQSRREVFLDKICIHQIDERLKLEGVLNVAALVKRSKSMLVCWDTSYIRRLWCVLEIAAFLQSHEEDAPLHIKPVTWAPVTVILFLGVCFLSVILVSVMDGLWESDIWSGKPLVAVALAVSVFMPLSVLCLSYASALMRGHFRAVDAMVEQLRSFSLKRDTVCHCCTANHLDKDGQRTPCDRHILEGSIRLWFGSVAEFDKLVQQQVRAAFEQKLRGYPAPYSWVIGATTPIVWSNFYYFIKLMAEGRYAMALADMCYITSYWLATIPIMAVFWACAARHLKTQQHQWWKEVLVNIACSLSVVAGYTVNALIEGILTLLLPLEWSKVAFAVTQVTLLAGLHGFLSRCFSAKAVACHENVPHHALFSPEGGCTLPPPKGVLEACDSF